MADVQGFRAVRYTGAAGALADLVAPPYDAVTQDERDRLYARSPYNVMHLTLPESPEDAGRLYRTWLTEGIVAREAEPSTWFLAEEYTGPDGIARERCGIVASLAVEPHSTGSVVPHERTDSRTTQERLRLLEELRVHPEPIFLLVDAALGVERPEADPDVAVNGSRLWRLDAAASESVRNAQLLIADGHHRYESVLAFAEAAVPPEARMMAVFVSTRDPGLRVFPTHRVFSGRRDLRVAGEGEAVESLEEAFALLVEEPPDRSVAIAYRDGSIELVRGNEAELDVELVDRHGLDGISYTPRAEEARAAVDSAEADVAFLLREPRLEDVFEVARRGQRMPSKSTYFFPKPLSGLLFHPLEP
ncbi:MAG: DUF1015 domain-containing protein [Actinobacteria bacterium]|nr:DUF1015 domain-containing protein [Actinomycetota bacterium]